VVDTARSPFPFFVGCGRSGTTLIRVMFDAHPMMAIPSGTGLIKRLAEDRALYERPDGFDVERFGAEEVVSGRFSSWGLGPEDLRASLADPRPVDLPDAVRRVYATFAATQRKPRYGNKSHGYVLAIPLIASVFPEARFVHIVRDGRNVALSLMEVPFGPSRIEAAARFWRRRVHQGRSDGRQLGPSRYREVRYEDLVADPAGVLPTLCEFLDLPFDPSMLRYYEKQARVAHTLKYPEIHRNLAEPPKPNVRDWRNVLDKRDLAKFEAVAGSTLRDFGYERASDIPRRLLAEEQAKGYWSRVRKKATKLLTVAEVSARG
jgi:Sulfotransferase family